MIMRRPLPEPRPKCLVSSPILHHLGTQTLLMFIRPSVAPGIALMFVKIEVDNLRHPVALNGHWVSTRRVIISL